MNEWISVIVPVYNVEKYLSKCIDSLLNQTYSPLEIILVDDGSKDGSGRICDEYAQKYAHIKVIHKENGGLSSARNAGIMNAEGSYIGFVDSDDYVAPNMYARLYDTLTGNHADMALCSYAYVTEAGSVLEQYKSPVLNEVLSQDEVLHKLVHPQYFYYVTAVNRLYKREIFETVMFPVGKCHEDEFTAHRFYQQCQSIACCSEILYYYVQRTGSITNTAFNVKRLDAIDALLDRIAFLEEMQHTKDSRETAYMIYGVLMHGVTSLDMHTYGKEVDRYIKRSMVKLLKYVPLHSVKLLLTHFLCAIKRVK